jgi:predicted kinase
MNRKLYILCGVPGSGKSQWAMQKLQEPAHEETVICSANGYFVQPDGAFAYDRAKLSAAHEHCMRSCAEQIVHYGAPIVIIDNTNMTRWERSPYDLLGRAHGYEVNFVYFHCDPEVAANRNIHGVPLETIHRMLARREDFLPWERARLTVIRT